MRDIKFRAWDKDREFMTSEPYYFEKHHYSDENRVNRVTYVYYEDWRDLEDGRYYQCELMQYTGLKDKNGREIYEGDILLDSQKGAWVVSWHDDHACFIVTATANRVVAEVIDNQNMTITGNIHEDAPAPSGKND